ncbi:SDR family NAD(P)-dependent oxidoreductase, partial [Mammaliicoccus fleurettii]
MFKDLEGKVVVITGAGSGIGKAMAEQFGDEKANVVINYRSERHLEVVSQTIKLIEDAGGKAIKVQADISKEDDVKRLIQSAVDQFSTLDILINNAGFEKPIPTHEMPLEEWQKVIDVNLTGAFIG